MEWLTQNWIWLALAIGMIFMMRRGGAGGCCGGHNVKEAPAKSADGPDRKAGGSAGGCH